MRKVLASLAVVLVISAVVTGIVVSRVGDECR